MQYGKLHFDDTQNIRQQAGSSRSKRSHFFHFLFFTSFSMKAFSFVLVNKLQLTLKL